MKLQLPHLVRMQLLWMMRMLMKMLRELMMTTSLLPVLVLSQVRRGCPYCLLSSGLAFGLAGCLYVCKLIGKCDVFFLTGPGLLTAPNEPGLSAAPRRRPLPVDDNDEGDGATTGQLKPKKPRKTRTKTNWRFTRELQDLFIFNKENCRNVLAAYEEDGYRWTRNGIQNNKSSGDTVWQFKCGCGRCEAKARVVQFADGSFCGKVMLGVHHDHDMDNLQTPQLPRKVELLLDFWVEHPAPTLDKNAIWQRLEADGIDIQNGFPYSVQRGAQVRRWINDQKKKRKEQLLATT
mmetsp:Transcript_6908/g.21776  ORF Transcript_6908/g.21776 Transcript_6908/m.21776 type:complete len:291 (+) Transcript_6908:221-1093(+)